MVAAIPHMQTQEEEPGALTLDDLKAEKVWVCFRREARNGKMTKPPFNPLTGYGARQNDPTTWATYEQAMTAFVDHQNHYDGIGFQFDPNVLPVMGVDLDHCVDPETGQMDAWASEIVELLASLTEYSPSGTGVHILIVGNARGIIRHKIPAREFTKECHPEAKVEIYDEKHYFTLTEKFVPGSPSGILPRQKQLQAVYEKITSRPASKVHTAPRSEKRPSFGPRDLTDNEIIERATQAQNGAAFRQLWQGDIGAQADWSTADFLLCQHLAFWTGKDAARMDRLFRRSGLYRDKWDRKTGNSTYGEITIRQAIKECRNTYTGTNGASRRAEEELERIFASRPYYRDDDDWDKKPHRIEPKEIPFKRVWECFELGEWGDALLFAEAFEGAVLYDVIEKAWYLWAGHYWKKDIFNQVKQLLSGHVAAIYIKASATLAVKVAEVIQQIEEAGIITEEADRLKGKRKELENQMKAFNERAKLLRNAKRNSNVLNAFATSDRRITVTSEQWDSHPWLLATPNGVINLKTGQCRDGRPGDFIRTVCPTTWKGLTEQCPRFLQFLEEIFQDRLPQTRAELIAFLKRLFGYAITGRTDEHIFPIFYGEEGRNGKDTLLAILKFVLGPIAGAINNDVLVASDKGRSGGAASPHLVDLQGKRLVWGSETKQGAVFNVAQVKLLTGGGEISARQLYGHQYTFKPTHTLFLITNYRPHADARDKAFWSRTCLIEFNARFVEKPKAPNEYKADSKLKETLEAEASGILAWLVQGCLDWQEQGINRPESVELATEQYRQSEDQLQMFADECCFTGDKSATIKASELYKTYQEWCKEGNLGAMNKNLFGMEFAKKYEKKRAAEGICYLGIRLRTENDPPPVSASHQTTTEATTQTNTDTGGGESYRRGYAGINQQAESLDQTSETLLAQVYEVVSLREKIFWSVPASGFSNGFVSPMVYLAQLRTCLASGERARIQAARKEINERLGL